MKTTKINKAYVVFTLFFFMMSWQLIKAQAVQTPYIVSNVNNGCSMTVDVDFYDGGATPCSSTTGQVIAGSSSFNFNAGGTCGTLTDVVVTLINVGGFTIPSNNIVNASLTWDSYIPVPATSCFQLIDIGWTSSETEIHIHK